MSAKKTHKVLLREFMTAMKVKANEVRDGELSHEEFMHWINGYASAAAIVADSEEDDA